MEQGAAEDLSGGGQGGGKLGACFQSRLLLHL
jgi:hypothetical protein